MSTHNICFYGEVWLTILKLSLECISKKKKKTQTAKITGPLLGGLI